VSVVSVDISHRYGELRVHQGVKFEVRANEFLCIAGPSGCGKTTLLDILAGILKPSEGEVRIDGSAADPKRHQISFVFQEPSTLPWLTVRDNVAVGLRVKKRPEAEIAAAVAEILDVVGLRGYEGYYPHQISGGMKQRVAIARALVENPDFIVMDEPFAALDFQTRVLMQRFLLEVWLEFKPTIIFVTHHIDEAVLLADRVVVMSAGPGWIIEEVRVDLPRPRRMTDPGFNDFRARLTETLEREVMRAHVEDELRAGSHAA